MSGTVLFIIPSFHPPKLATRKELFPPSQRQVLNFQEDNLPGEWHGSSYPVDPPGLWPWQGQLARPAVLACGACTEAQDLFRAEFIQTEPNRKLGSPDSL
jgi:hypothetical protein